MLHPHTLIAKLCNMLRMRVLFDIHVIDVRNSISGYDSAEHIFYIKNLMFLTPLSRFATYSCLIFFRWRNIVNNYLQAEEIIYAWLQQVKSKYWYHQTTCFVQIPLHIKITRVFYFIFKIKLKIVCASYIIQIFFKGNSGIYLAVFGLSFC